MSWWQNIVSVFSQKAEQSSVSHLKRGGTPPGGPSESASADADLAYKFITNVGRTLANYSLVHDVQLFKVPLPLRLWPLYERELRARLLSWQYDDGLPKKQRRAAQKLQAQNSTIPPQVLGIISFAPSGFLREAAVTALARSSSGAALPFLLLRGNDWVGAVRAHAKQALFARLEKDYITTWLDSLELVQWLGSTGRADHKDLLAAVHELISREATNDQLLHVLQRGHLRTRRYVADLLLASPGKLPLEQFKLLATDRDPLIRMRLPRASSSILSNDELQHYLEAASADRSVMVREEALKALANISWSLAKQRLWENVSHPSRGIRGTARYLISRNEAHQDFAAYYRSRLEEESKRDLYGLLMGLGETGSPEDVAIAESFLHHPLPRMRKAAVLAVSSLSKSGRTHIYYKAIHDQAPTVQKAARAALLKELGELNVWDLHVHYAQGGELTRRNLVYVARQLPKWKSIEALLKFAKTPESDDSEAIHAALKEWVQKSNSRFISISEGQLAELRRLMLSAKGNIPDPLFGLLDFYLK